MEKRCFPAERKRIVRFIKHVGRGINRFHMIEDGDHILIGISGGKDSLALAYALSERKKWVPIDYSLTAMQIEWTEFPISREERRNLDNYFDSLRIPLIRRKAAIFPDSFNGDFNCYICSRNRKRILFDEAEELGIHKIALGHHLDDIVETTLINLFFRGEISTMMPVQDFFGGKLQIIRPMCEVPEREVERAGKILDLPVVPVRCPKGGISDRLFVKDMVKRMARKNKHVRENIYRASWNIKTDYLPLHLQEK